MNTHSLFDARKNKLDYYRGKDCIERFLKNLKEHALKIINYKKKEITPSTYEENRSYKKQKVCYICKQGCNTNECDKNAFLYTIK